MFLHVYIYVYIYIYILVCDPCISMHREHETELRDSEHSVTGHVFVEQLF